MVKVLYFGEAQDVAGRSEEMLTTTDTASLRKQLTEKYPAMRSIPFRMALNRRLLNEESMLNKNDIIAILPPFQGG